MRTNRATKSNYCKATRKDREILRVVGKLVGMKKTLVFYKGRAPRGEKMKWVSEIWWSKWYSENASKKAFSFGASSRNNPSWNSGFQLGVSGVVLVEMMKSKTSGDKSGGNVAFNFKVFESKNTKSFDESMVK
ncbi:hypothetical protein L6452_37701 [Arctium lappa]|uniref:Uncharacterized protein n=1 Tax=Arctium lappa TaxID=4217 RepID=A0ACB8Y486_ARCLA|nr:hypothetical protein L6452_37701 [Arctium lappa]